MGSLEAAGYNNYWQVLNAKDFGIPQNRERVFIVSIRKDIDTGMFQFPEGFPLELRLKDMLEDDVDEKFYIDTSIDTCSGGNRMPKVLVREATKKGFAEAYEGDSINLEQPNSKTRRVRVGHQVAQTLTTSCNQAVVEPIFSAAMCGRYSEDGTVHQNIEVSDREYANALTTVQKDSLVAEPQIIEDFYKSRDERVYEEYSPSLRADRTGLKVKTMLRIRKLTPKECLRLMGFEDEDFEKAEAVNSNTQLYKQAGNSIVVDVLEALFKSLQKAGVI